MADNPETFCPNCGSVWFEIIDDDEANTGGAVMVDPKGRVTCRSGALRCYECEEPLVLTALRADLDQELARILAES